MSDSTARATPTDVLEVTTIELAAITLQLHQSFVLHKAQYLIECGDTGGKDGQVAFGHKVGKSTGVTTRNDCLGEWCEELRGERCFDMYSHSIPLKYIMRYSFSYGNTLVAWLAPNSTL